MRFALGIFVALLLPAMSRAQQPKVVVPFEGTQAFCHILHSFALKPIAALERLWDVPPRETILIVFGTNEVLADIDLAQFHKEGGAVLIASDRPDQNRLETFGVSINGLPMHEDEATAYRGLPECPYVADGLTSAHPLFHGLAKGLATNNPSLLRPRHSDLRVLANYSPRSAPISFRFAARLFGSFAFLMGSPTDAPPENRVAILAGHGLFMNGMMVQKDSDNFAFAWNCVSWLRGPEDKPRRHALFIEEGKIVPKFDVSLTVPMPVPIPTVEAINRLLHGLEQENFFNRAVLGRDDANRNAILRTMVIVGTLLLVFFGAVRLFKSRHSLDVSVPLVWQQLEPAPAAPPLLQQRHLALLERQNLWEPARAVARAWWSQHAGIDWSETTTMPPAHVRGAWSRRWSLGRTLRRLWTLATATEATPLSRRDFDKLHRTLDDLTGATMTGSIVFANLERTARTIVTSDQRSVISDQ